MQLARFIYIDSLTDEKSFLFHPLEPFIRRRDERERIGACIGQELVDLTPVVGERSMISLIESWSRWRPQVESALTDAERIPLADIRLKAPLERPGKFLLLAGNYREHVMESGYAAPPEGDITPQFFLKPATTIIGPNDPIVITPRNVAVDWEAELAVVIGRRGRDIKPEEAPDYVFGYTVVNDVSERRLNSNRPGRRMRPRDEFFDWLTGKWFDSFAPMGPVIVTTDEIPDPSRLTIRAHLNGEEVQCAKTSAMIFAVPELIAYISEIVTLEPGDVISTGTPAGVGLSRGRFLQPGDTIVCEIEGIGALVNPIIGSR